MAIVAALDPLDLPAWTRDDAAVWWVRWRSASASGRDEVDRAAAFAGPEGVGGLHDSP